MSFQVSTSTRFSGNKILFNGHQGWSMLSRDDNGPKMGDIRQFFGCNCNKRSLTFHGESKVIEPIVISISEFVKCGRVADYLSRYFRQPIHSQTFQKRKKHADTTKATLECTWNTKLSGNCQLYITLLLLTQNKKNSRYKLGCRPLTHVCIRLSKQGLSDVYRYRISILAIQLRLVKLRT